MKIKVVVFDTDDDLEIRVYNSQGNRIGTSKLSKKEVKDGDLFSSSSRVYEFDIDIITPKDMGNSQSRGNTEPHDARKDMIEIMDDPEEEPGAITLIWYNDKRNTKDVKATRTLKIFTPCKGHLEDYQRYDHFKIDVNPNYNWDENNRHRLKEWYEQDVLKGRAK